MLEQFLTDSKILTGLLNTCARERPVVDQDSVQTFILSPVSLSGPKVAAALSVWDGVEKDHTYIGVLLLIGVTC